MTDTPLHATCVAVEERAVLLTGPSGSGKSALALQLIALGATLVADDRTCLVADGSRLWASPPDTIAGLIEARGVGLFQLPHLDRAPVNLVVDMGRTETDRLPPQRRIELQGIGLPCLHKVDAPYFPAAIHAYLKGTMIETP